MTTYVVDAECRTCGNEQQHLVELPTRDVVDVDDPDDEMHNALDEQAHDCDQCGDNDWSPMGFKVHHP
jgi:hypothetical protein